LPRSPEYRFPLRTAKDLADQRLAERIQLYRSRHAQGR
jgi:hypothetical protein